METVKDILEHKGTAQVWFVTPETSAREALHLMAEKNVGAVPVMNQDGSMAGIFSERDYARKTLSLEDDPLNAHVRDLMSTKVMCIRPTTTVEECMALMTESRIRHLPVYEGDHLKGIVSIGDVVKATIAEKEFVIEQLEHYITGSL
jgi:CBS domain-containing protein